MELDNPLKQPDMDGLLVLALRQAAEHLQRYGVAHAATPKVLMNAIDAVSELARMRVQLQNAAETLVEVKEELDRARAHEKELEDYIAQRQLTAI